AAGVERMLADGAAPLGAGQRGLRFHETAPQLAAPENADWDAGPAAAVLNQLKDQGVDSLFLVHSVRNLPHPASVEGVVQIPPNAVAERPAFFVPGAIDVEHAEWSWADIF